MGRAGSSPCASQLPLYCNKSELRTRLCERFVLQNTSRGVQNDWPWARCSTVLRTPKYLRLATFVRSDQSLTSMTTFDWPAIYTFAISTSRTCLLLWGLRVRRQTSWLSEYYAMWVVLRRPSIFGAAYSQLAWQPNAQWVLSSVTLLGARQRRETFLVAFGTDDRHKIGLNSFAECRMQLPPR
jgi:hypothetical protein